MMKTELLPTGRLATATGDPIMTDPRGNPKTTVGIAAYVGIFLVALAFLGICFGPFEFEIAFPDMPDFPDMGDFPDTAE